MNVWRLFSIYSLGLRRFSWDLEVTLCVCVRALWSDWTLPFPAVCLNSASVCTVLSGWLDWLSLMLPVWNPLCPKKHLEIHLRGRPSSAQWWKRTSTWFSIQRLLLIGCHIRCTLTLFTHPNAILNPCVFFFYFTLVSIHSLSS